MLHGVDQLRVEPFPPPAEQQPPPWHRRDASATPAPHSLAPQPQRPPHALPPPPSPPSPRRLAFPSPPPHRLPWLLPPPPAPGVRAALSGWPAAPGQQQRRRLVYHGLQRSGPRTVPVRERRRRRRRVVVRAWPGLRRLLGRRCVCAHGGSMRQRYVLTAHSDSSQTTVHSSQRTAHTTQRTAHSPHRYAPIQRFLQRLRMGGCSSRSSFLGGLALHAPRFLHSHGS